MSRERDLQIAGVLNDQLTLINRGNPVDVEQLIRRLSEIAGVQPITTEELLSRKPELPEGHVPITHYRHLYANHGRPYPPPPSFRLGVVLTYENERGLLVGAGMRTVQTGPMETTSGAMVATKECVDLYILNSHRGIPPEARAFIDRFIGVVADSFVLDTTYHVRSERRDVEHQVLRLDIGHKRFLETQMKNG